MSPLEEILKQIGIIAAIGIPTLTIINYLDSWAQREARRYRIREILDYAKFYKSLKENDQL